MKNEEPKAILPIVVLLVIHLVSFALVFLLLIHLNLNKLLHKNAIIETETKQTNKITVV